MAHYENQPAPPHPGGSPQHEYPLHHGHAPQPESPPPQDYPPQPNFDGQPMTHGQAPTTLASADSNAAYPPRSPMADKKYQQEPPHLDCLPQQEHSLHDGHASEPGSQPSQPTASTSKDGKRNKSS